MRISAATREVTLKIVYYGPGLSGKTTNLVQLHQLCPRGQRGALVQLDTETERTLFFDYFPLVAGTLGGFRIKVDFFTVPGQSFYHATRRAVLEGTDGVVFVADSSGDREGANLVARNDLIANLTEAGRSLHQTPHVYQWNKRDLRKPIPLPVLEAGLNPEGAPSLCAIAARGEGVWEAQSTLMKLVFEGLRSHAEVERRHA
jgi:GTPase SAR1 family protein